MEIESEGRLRGLFSVSSELLLLLKANFAAIDEADDDLRSFSGCRIDVGVAVPEISATYPVLAGIIISCTGTSLRS